MTIFWLCGIRNRQRQRQQRGRYGWLTVYIPPIPLHQQSWRGPRSQTARWMGHSCVFWPGEENRQRQRRGVGWETVVVEKRISPLRCSQSARAASVEMTIPGFCWGKKTGNGNSKDNGVCSSQALVEWMGAGDSAAGRLFSGDIMADPAPLSYVIYIAAPPEKVWDGFVSPESNRILFMGAELGAEWKTGGSMAWVGPGPDGKPMKYVHGEVLRFDSPKVLQY